MLKREENGISFLDLEKRGKIALESVRWKAKNERFLKAKVTEVRMVHLTGSSRNELHRKFDQFERNSNKKNRYLLGNKCFFSKISV